MASDSPEAGLAGFFIWLDRSRHRKRNGVEKSIADFIAVVFSDIADIAYVSHLLEAIIPGS